MSTLTMDKMLAARRMIEGRPRVFPAAGFNIVSTDGGHWVPVRAHSKRANGGKASYHRRVQKKWDKRFGQRWQEIQKRGEVFRIGRDTLVVRKDDLNELHRLTARQTGE